jgi:Universal stress protein family.
METLFPIFARIDPTHPEEYVPIFLVVAFGIAGAFFLLRVIFAGHHERTAALPAKTFSSVVVPTCDSLPVETLLTEALPVACSLTAARPGARVVVTYSIAVPRALPPDAPMPEEEEAARALLERAAKVGRAYGVPVATEVRKGRKFVDDTLKAANEHRADLVVLVSAPPPAGVAEDPVLGAEDITGDGRPETLSSALLRRLTCEVVVIRHNSPSGGGAPSPIDSGRRPSL